MYNQRYQNQLNTKNRKEELEVLIKELRNIKIYKEYDCLKSEYLELFDHIRTLPAAVSVFETVNSRIQELSKN